MARERDRKRAREIGRGRERDKEREGERGSGRGGERGRERGREREGVGERASKRASEREIARERQRERQRERERGEPHRLVGAQLESESAPPGAPPEKARALKLISLQKVDRRRRSRGGALQASRPYCIARLGFRVQGSAWGFEI